MTVSSCGETGFGSQRPARPGEPCPPLAGHTWPSNGLGPSPIHVVKVWVVKRSRGGFGHSWGTPCHPIWGAMALTYFEIGPCTMPRHIVEVEIHKYIINTNSNSMYIYIYICITLWNPREKLLLMFFNVFQDKNLLSEGLRYCSCV